MSTVKYPEVTVTLSGEDGNAFNLLGRVSRAIRDHEGVVAAAKFLAEADSCESYDELIQLAMRTVNVE